jgi:glutamate/tyrosine decarboxylase-like PLP-dependent enzyme
MTATNRRFAEEGQSWPEVEAAMSEVRRDDKVWNDRRNLRAAYDAGADVIRVANEAFNMHMGDNAIFRSSSYPSLLRYEAEVVDMVLEMLNAPQGAAGSVTTGGTESIVMAVKAARNWARDHCPMAERPEIVVPRTAHPAFDKSAEMLGLSVVRMTESREFRADVDAMSRAVNENTIMLVGSAPPYPHAMVDPISEMATLAGKHGLWLHVDACIGGFFLPFARELGRPMPAFDFTLDGVNSISVDLHKYGYANRGVSTLLLRDAELLAYHRFSWDNWPAGRYTTTAIAGSRNAGALASAWAVMRYLGCAGYRERVAKILAVKERMIETINAIDELTVWGEPHGGHFSFGSEQIDIFAVADGMAELGWLSGLGTEPKSMILILNAQHEAIVEDYLRDLADIVVAVRCGRIESRGGDAVYIG